MSAAFTLETIPASQVTDGMLGEAAALFSSAYGVWGPEAAEKMSKYCRPGMSVSLHRSICTDTINMYARQDVRRASARAESCSMHQ